MRLEKLPKSEFQRRISSVQKEMKKKNLDVLVTYSSENESASSRYLTDFWPFFDFAGVIIPAEGEAALVTGGPESYDFAKRFSYIDNILINPLYVETSAPDWVPDVEGESFEQILPRLCGKTPKRVGLGDWNIFPFLILEDLKKGAPDAEFIPADDILLSVRTVKADVEIPSARESGLF